MPTKYRKSKDGDTWHFHQGCTDWPETNYDVSYAKPDGEICDECKAKQLQGA